MPVEYQPASASWWQWPAFVPSDEETISSATSFQDNRLAVWQQYGSAVIAELVPDPASKYDPRSVRVDVAGVPVGYIYQSTQELWNAALRGLNGARALVRARIIGSPGYLRASIIASTRRLDPARGFLYGPSSVTVKVLPEHQAWLRANVLPGAGAPASLLPADGGLVVVVGGYSVGTLSKVSATNYSPVATESIRRGFGAGCWMTASDSADGSPKFRVKLADDVAAWTEAATRFPAAESAPAWHPDPRGRNEYRFWDGTAWTDSVSNGGVRSSDPV